MKALKIAAPAAAASLLLSYKCYKTVFCRGPEPAEDEIFDGSPLASYRDEIDRGLRFIDAQPFEQVYMTAWDGVRLAAKYYPAENERSLVILFHGYRSTAKRDFSYIFSQLLGDGRSVLLVDQRAHGLSGGDTIGFGVLERLDCLDWVNYAVERFGSDLPIFIYGVSMGASTVLLACEFPLPANVAGIVADCGFTSVEEIIKVGLRRRGRHASLAWPLVRLGALVFGRFDPADGKVEEALRRCRLPVLFIHGEGDRLTPCDMSRRNYAACAGEAVLVTVPGAGHGLSYPADSKKVGTALCDFFERYGG